MNLERLNPLLERDGFIIYISGAKEKGKTDFGLWLAEYCYRKNFRTKIATNIETESYMIERQITNLPDLKGWLEESKRKLFLLDEAGLTIPKLRFMASINVEVMKILQMIRHYDAGFIGIAPSTKNIDSTFMDTDILDAHIKKLNKFTAIVRDSFQKDTYFLEGINGTSIKFNSKHIAEFTMSKPIDRTTLPLCCQVANSYRLTKSIKQTAEAFKLNYEQVRREIFKHLSHDSFTIHNNHGGSKEHEEPKTLSKTT